MPSNAENRRPVDEVGLILPDWHRPNLGSRVLALCLKRLGRDWLERFGHRLLLVETFVDPQRFRGTLYQAANWSYVGESRGFRRIRDGYSAESCAPKKVFVRGYKAMADWVQSLSPAARERFGCRLDQGRRIVPSEYVIRDVLIRVDPLQLDRALQRWNETYGQQDVSLAIDGKTMCNAIDEKGNQTHIMSVIGHQSQACYTQKKSVPCP